MNRRRFLQASALTAAPLVINRLPVYAGQSLPEGMLKALATTAGLCNRVLVIIQMNGGNDGLNTVIPLDKYSQLSTARPDLLIPHTTTNPNVLALNGTTTTGLHPAMTGIRDLFNNGKMVIVQGVSYPNPNYSHFQAQDIWFTANNTLPSPNTGWLGNALDADYPGFPNGYPPTGGQAGNPAMDPPAIQIGGSLPLSLQGPNINMGYNVPTSVSLQQIANATTAGAPPNDYGTELTFLRLMKQQSNAYATRISTAYNGPTGSPNSNLSTMYATSGNSLSDQLKVVARLIRGGLTTPIFVVNHSDTFDLHVSQVAGASGATNPLAGSHYNALSKLSVAVSAFMDDVQLMGQGHRVLGMTFSEFGRRVIQNASTGTDHGSAAPVMLFGNNLQGSVIGTSPNLPATITGSTQVPMQYDFRQIYATIMQQWMCLSASTTNSVLGGTFATLPLFNGVALAGEGMTLSGAWQGSTAQLEAKVEGADGFRAYTIQRSFDGSAYHSIGSLPLESSAAAQTIRYTDWSARDTTAEEVYYRIRGIRNTGDEVFSNTAVLRVATGQGQAVRIFPNPVRGGRINVEFLKPVDGEVRIGLYDARGARLFGDQRRTQGSSMQIQVPAEDYDAHALYILKLVWDGREVAEKLTFE